MVLEATEINKLQTEDLPTLPTLPDLFNKYLKDCGLSIPELAFDINCDPSNLKKLQKRYKDKTTTSLSNVEKMAKKFRLNTVDETEFYMAGGYAPPVLLGAARMWVVLATHLNIYSQADMLHTTKDAFAAKSVDIIKYYPKDVAVDPEPAPSLADFLMEKRKERGLSRNELGYCLGIDPSYFTRLERNERGASKTTLEKVANFLELPLPDRLGLILLGGHVPDQLAVGYPWLLAITTSAKFIENPRYSSDSKQKYNSTLELMAKNWHGSGF